MKLVEMEVKGLALDPATNAPVVILRDPVGGRILPIWIGLFEANAIATRLREPGASRPMTHDLFGGVLAAVGARLESVEISELSEGTFYALLHLSSDGREVEVDSRPSDAIAIALRSGAPILVREVVLEEAGGLEAEEDGLDDERTKAWLENLRPEDFGGSCQ